MQSEPSYYELLGVDRHATNRALDEAYRQQVLRNHPDNGGNRAVFDLITHAYEVLSDPTTRAAYDEGPDNTPPRGNVIPLHAFSANSAEEASTYSGEPTSVYSAAPTNESDYRDSAGYGIGDATSPQPERTPVIDAPPQEPRYTRENTESRSDLRNMSTRQVIIALVAVWIFICLLTPLPIFPGVGDGEAFFLLIFCILGWMMLSFSIRMFAWMVVLYAAVMAMTGEANAAETTIRIVFAFGVWLVGHWIYTWRKGTWKSMIAYQVLSLLPTAMRPDRKQVEAMSYPAGS